MANASSSAAPNAAAQNIRLVVLDIDGTIAGEDNQVSPAVKDAVKAVQAKGIPVAIATGRMYCSALRFHQAIGSTLPLASYQGALIKDPSTDETHQHLPVSREAATRLLDYFDQVDQQMESNHPLSVHFYIEDRLYVREISEETQAYAERSGITPIAVGDLRTTLDREPTKILALSEDTRLIDHVLFSLRQRYTPAELYFTKSVATFFEAANPQVNKGAAVKYFAETMLGLDPSQVMAVGDNFNDVEMLSYAGVGVAMGNAPPEVQAFANWIAPDVEQDGVAAAIAQFIL